MSHGGEVELLRRAIGLASRSAVAWKAAYMRALEQGTVDVLRRRCTDRYALLERLIGLLVERSLNAGEVRTLLDGLDSDPDQHDRLELALTAARTADSALADLLVDALEEAALPPELEGCLEATLTALHPGERTRPKAAAATAARVACRGGARILLGPAAEPGG